MGKEQDLLQAVKSGDLLSTQKLLSKLKTNRNKLLGSTKRLNVNYQDSDGFSALHHAALTGTSELLAALLEAQATVDIKDSNGMRPLHYAAWQGKAESVLMLLRSGASVNGASLDGHIPLHLAAQYGHYEVVSASVLRLKVSPLEYICVAQLLLSSNMVVALLEGERKEPMDSAFTTPLHLAARNGHKDVIRVRVLTKNEPVVFVLTYFLFVSSSDATGVLQVRALKDYWNLHDPTALNIRAGDLITVRRPALTCRLRGCRRRHGKLQLIKHIYLCVRHAQSSLSELLQLRPHSTLNTDASFSPLAAPGDRNSVGSTGSVGSTRSAGSGQSTESSHAPNGLQHHAIPHDLLRVGGTPRRQTVTVQRPAEQSFSQQFVRPQQLLDGKDAEAIYEWLSEFQLEQYIGNFLNAGYDVPTISRMTPEDLTAIGVTKPGHRKKISIEINNLNIPEWLPEYIPSDLCEWLSAIGLPQYHKKLSENGYDSISIVKDLTWEDLQEIGITKLGHQKKLMLAVKKLCDIQRAILQAESGHGTLRRKGPGALHLVAIEADAGSECSSPHTPKMLTFQDSELSAELQTAMSSHYGDCEEGLAIKNAVGMSQSQESIDTRSRGSGRSQEPPTASITPQNWSQESLEGSPAKERNLPEGWDQRPLQQQPLPKQVPLGTATVFKYPAIPAKPKLPGSQGSSPHGSPTLKGFSYLNSSPRHQHHAMTLTPPNKRTQSITRYALSDGEPDEDDEDLMRAGNVPSYATLTRKPGRHQLARLQPSPDKNGSVGRSQSFAVRARKKGPPPPPPKRLSSVSSTTSGELSDSSTTSSTGGVVTDSPGSVRSIAASLESCAEGKSSSTPDIVQHEAPSPSLIGLGPTTTTPGAPPSPGHPTPRAPQVQTRQCNGGQPTPQVSRPRKRRPPHQSDQLLSKENRYWLS
uniref:CASK interacting protein 2 n=1 Tax=Neolamprologus brichardi TaxID=32507 RepID=A0A3Q4HXX9_NEOBR